jgi:hypothetical protein
VRLELRADEVVQVAFGERGRRHLHEQRGFAAGLAPLGQQQDRAADHPAVEFDQQSVFLGDAHELFRGDDLAARRLHPQQDFVILVASPVRLIIGWKFSTNWSSRNASLIRWTQAWMRLPRRDRGGGVEDLDAVAAHALGRLQALLALAMICGRLAIFSPICTPPMLTVRESDCGRPPGGGRRRRAQLLGLRLRLLVVVRRAAAAAKEWSVKRRGDIVASSWRQALRHRLEQLVGVRQADLARRFS